MTEDPSKAMLKSHFYASLGQFINLFSIVENAARKLMSTMAGADEATALALFSGVRTDQAIANIRRMYLARKEPIPPALDAALQQLAVINGFRNDILHHRVDFEQTPPVTTNRAAVLTDSAVRETVIEASTLLNAGFDLGRILLILAGFTYPENPRAQDDIDFAIREPWHHKPASQPRKRSPKRKGRREH